MKLIIASALAVCFAMPAWAESICAPLDAIRIGPLESLGESQAASGLLYGGNVQMQLYLNPEAATWTVIYVGPNGIACVLGGGTDFEISPVKSAPEGDPT